MGDGAAACLPNGAWAALPTCLPIGKYQLTLSTLQTKTGTLANSAVPDATNLNESSRQELLCLPFGFGYLNDTPVV